MRKAFGIWMALLVILIVSGMMVVVLKYASISAKHTQNSYVREQLELFLNSAIEQTLLQISFHNRSSGCLSSATIIPVTKRDITYSADVNITKYYLQKGSTDLTNCSTLGVQIGDGLGDSHGMVLLEVEVMATKSNGNVVGRILRRTLQQP
jgi:type II secretory pathway pseudopilin PulG